MPSVVSLRMQCTGWQGQQTRCSSCCKLQPSNNSGFISCCPSQEEVDLVRNVSEDSAPTQCHPVEVTKVTPPKIICEFSVLHNRAVKLLVVVLLGGFTLGTMATDGHVGAMTRVANQRSMIPNFIRNHTHHFCRNGCKPLRGVPACALLQPSLPARMTWTLHSVSLSTSQSQMHTPASDHIDDQKSYTTLAARRSSLGRLAP